MRPFLLTICTFLSVTQICLASLLGSLGWVRLDAQGGSGGTDFATTYEGQQLPTITPPTRTGHQFTGYYSLPKGGGVRYYSESGTGVKICNWGSWNTFTLYANWQRRKYKANFNANGGTGGASLSVLYGDKIKAPRPSRTGYSFAGWTPSVASTMPAHDVTYTAKWTPRRYRIAFAPNGGSGKMAAQTLTYGKPAKLPATRFSRKGFVFIGWAKSRNGAVAYANAATVKNLAAGGTVTLYAQWAKQTYRVAFNANGGKGKMAVQTLTYGRGSKLRANAFSRKEHVFLGWATSKANATKGAVKFTNGKAVKNLTRGGSTITLYAVWARRNYKIAFAANGGTGKMAAQTLTYGVAAALRKNTFKRGGYTFQGWSRTPTGSIAYRNGTSVKNLTRSGSTITLYAIWKKNPTPSVGTSGSGGTSDTSKSGGSGLIWLPSPESLGIGGGPASHLCITCRGTGSCPVCRGVGVYSNYGYSSPCNACSATGRCWECHGQGRTYE